MNAPLYFISKKTQLDAIKQFAIYKSLDLNIKYFGEINSIEDEYVFLNSSLKHNKINILNITGIIDGLYIVPKRNLIVFKGEFGNIALSINDLLDKEYEAIFNFIKLQNRLLKIFNKDDLNTNLVEFIIGFALLNVKFSFLQNWNLKQKSILIDSVNILTGGIMHLSKSSFLLDAKIVSFLLIKEVVLKNNFFNQIKSVDCN